MFSRWKIARTPGIFSAALVSIRWISPFAMVLQTGTAYSMPGNWWSDVYMALPLTFSGPSTRGCSLPMTDVGPLCVAAMIDSPDCCLRRLGHLLQRVDEAAPGQFHLEAVLAPRSCVAQRGVSRPSKRRLPDGLTCKYGFGLCRSPGLRADASQGNARARHPSIGNRDHHRGRRDRDF